MHPIWSGTVSFGLINIPVRLYSASEIREINFDMLHKEDLAPIRYARICTADGKEIPYKDIVKGYQYQKGDYVVLLDKDFERASLQRSKTMQIHNFTYESEIDPIYYDKPYFLEPDKDAAKAYSLLRDALKQSEKVAIVSYVLRNREHIGIVKPYEDMLLLNQLRYQSEIRDWGSLSIPEKHTTHKEVEMAIKLIDQLTGSFNPDDFKDNYVQELKVIIQEKLKGVKPKKREAEKELKLTPAKDIMAQLKASLESVPKKQTPARKKRKKGVKAA
jgi:DNA end-binding protein Ku